MISIEIDIDPPVLADSANERDCLVDTDRFLLAFRETNDNWYPERLGSTGDSVESFKIGKVEVADGDLFRSSFCDALPESFHR